GASEPSVRWQSLVGMMLFFDPFPATIVLFMSTRPPERLRMPPSRLPVTVTLPSDTRAAFCTTMPAPLLAIVELTTETDAPARARIPDEEFDHRAESC